MGHLGWVFRVFRMPQDDLGGGLEALEPAVCKEEVSWRRMDNLPVQWAVLEYSGIMHRPRPDHMGVKKKKKKKRGSGWFQTAGM